MQTCIPVLNLANSLGTLIQRYGLSTDDIERKRWRETDRDTETERERERESTDDMERKRWRETDRY